MRIVLAMTSFPKAQCKLNDTNFFVNLMDEIKRARLLFAQNPQNLKPFDCSIGGFHGVEAQSWFAQPFKLAMICFDDVVQIFYRPTFSFFVALVLFLQYLDCLGK